MKRGECERETEGEQMRVKEKEKVRGRWWVGEGGGRVGGLGRGRR